MRVSREHAEHQDRYHKVRKCTLDDWSSQTRDYTGEHISRKDSVHGGSVAADIEVIISLYDGTERAELWKQAFERSYGVSFETLKRHWWEKPHNVDRAAKIIRFADDVISEWKMKPRTYLFGNGTHASRLLKEIKKL